MKNIIFDLDGTLFNTFYLHTSCLKEVYMQIYNTDITDLKILKNNKSTIWLQIQSIFGKETKMAMNLYILKFCNKVQNGELHDFINVSYYLNKLITEHKVNLHLFTGRDTITTSSILNYFHIQSLFNTIFCCDEEKLCSKNISNIFNNMEQIIYITDSIKEIHYSVNYNNSISNIENFLEVIE